MFMPKNRNMYTILTNSPLFRGLQPQKLEMLLHGLNFQTKTYPKETLIKFAQEECNALIIIEEGVVRGEMTDISGKVLKVEDISAPNAIAFAFLFGRNNKFPVNVISNTACKLIFIPKQEFVRLLQEDETILVNYLNMVSSKVQFLSSRLSILSLKDLKSKLAHFILQQTQNGKLVNFRMSQNQTQLADFFGVARPSLARALKQFVDEGVIELNRSDVKILDMQALKVRLAN
jgi:CRP-like cAMP-binding protein